MLTLPIKAKWFNMILSGEKKEEYRETKSYYTSRFNKLFNLDHVCISEGTEEKEIRFVNGYGRERPAFIAKCTLEITSGRVAWGAEYGKTYYVLKIHEIRDRFKC